MPIPQRPDDVYIPPNWLWIFLLIVGYLVLMSYFVTAMIWPSSSNATSLGGAILMIGLALFLKTNSDTLLVNKRISDLEKQLELHKQESTTLKEKQ